jgi:hypothetical protein
MQLTRLTQRFGIVVWPSYALNERHAVAPYSLQMLPRYLT